MNGQTIIFVGMNYQITAKKHSGTILIPPSKSDSQRALLIASLGNGLSTLHNVGSSEDEKAMIENIQQIGATIEWIDKKTLKVQGGVNQHPIHEINCGESGLGLRLLTAIATLMSSPVKMVGSGSLLNRNHNFFERFFPQMNVEVVSNEGKLPITIKGPLHAGTFRVDGSESSQYISGLLIAFSQTEGQTSLIVENSSSTPYIDMTLQTLRHFGVKIGAENSIYVINGRQSIQPTDYTIDGDWSSASFWLVASALGLDISVDGLSMTSKQADKAILNAFISANCRVLNTENGIVIDGSNRTALDFDATNCPDLFPALATYSALTLGISKIKGVHRLANKESDRGKALVEEFQKLGVFIKIEGDYMLIEGGSKIKSATVHSHHDHRIAMCLAILGLVSQLEITIETAEAVGKSYPNFWSDLEQLSE